MNKNYTANELNFVLDSLFYFKFQGNIVAHINISPEDSIKIKNTDINIQKINYFLNTINKSNSNFSSNNRRAQVNVNINNSNSNNKNMDFIEKSKFNIENKNVINDTNSNLNNISERIINNINLKKKDWLEVENDVDRGVNQLIKVITDKIVSDFYDSTINKKLSIIDIINIIFKNDYNNMFETNSAFTRILSQIIDNLIKNRKLDFNFSKFDKLKTIIFQISEEYDSIDDLIERFKDFKILLNDIIYKHIKTYIHHYLDNILSNDLAMLNISYIQFLKSIIKKTSILYNMDENEKKALMMSLILAEIKSIEIKYLDNFIINLHKSIKRYYILDNTKRLLKDFYKAIEDYVKKSTNDTDLLSEIKSFINKKKSSSMNVDMTYEKLIDIITKLFENETMEWTKLHYSDISLESLLFYYQNN